MIDKRHKEGLRRTYSLLEAITMGMGQIDIYILFLCSNGGHTTFSVLYSANLINIV